MAIERKILTVALAAGSRSSIEAWDHNLTSDEIGLLNEQWAQSYIGIEINDCLRKSYANAADKSFVSFETSVSWLEGFLGEKRGPGRIPGSLRDRQRFDVTVWSKGGRVAGLVEIKDQPIMQEYSRTADPGKICRALKRWPSIRWGMFLFSVRSSGSNRFKSLRDELDVKRDKVFASIDRACSANIADLGRNDDVLEAGGCMVWGGVLFRP